LTTGTPPISREQTANEERRITIETSSQSDRSKRLLSEALEIMRRLCAQLKYGYEKDSQFDTECFPSFKFKEWFQILTLYPALPSPESEELKNLDYEFQTLLSDRLPHAERFKESNRSPEDIIQKSSKPEKAEKHREHYSLLSNHMRSKIRDYLISRIEQGTLENPPLNQEFEETITYFFINPSYWQPDEVGDNLPSVLAKAATSRHIADSAAFITLHILSSLGNVLRGEHFPPTDVTVPTEIKANPDYFAQFWQAAQYSDNKLEDLKSFRERVKQAIDTSTNPHLTIKELNAAFPLITPSSFSNPVLQA
ncbi:MAG: hypothetical protein OJI67_22440, partial [Prosthecobacter sp.]|nr:hypothetical protein [Prosthecobacter sp.]